METKRQDDKDQKDQFTINLEQGREEREEDTPIYFIREIHTGTEISLDERLGRQITALKYYLFMIHHQSTESLSEREIANIMGVTCEAIRLARKKLADLGYIQETRLTYQGEKQLRITLLAPPQTEGVRRYRERIYRFPTNLPQRASTVNQRTLGDDQRKPEADQRTLVKQPTCVGEGTNVRWHKNKSNKKEESKREEDTKEAIVSSSPNLLSSTKRVYMTEGLPGPSQGPSLGEKGSPSTGMSRKGRAIFLLAQVWSDLHEKHVGRAVHAGQRDYKALKELMAVQPIHLIADVMRAVIAHKRLHALWSGMDGDVPLHRFCYHFSGYANEYEKLKTQELRSWAAFRARNFHEGKWKEGNLLETIITRIPTVYQQHLRGQLELEDLDQLIKEAQNGESDQDRCPTPSVG